MNKPLIIILLIVCVLFSGFFSGAEIVYSMVNKIRLKKEADCGNKKAMKALELANNFPTLLSTILVGNNLVNIAASSLATILFTLIWPDNGAIYAGFIMTAIILIFGEIMPKAILGKASYNASKVLSLPISIIEYIFKPIVFVITVFINKISPLWTPKIDEDEEDTSGEELINMVETIEEEGFIDNDTKELVTSAIELKDTQAQEIMKPRVDIFSFNIEDNVKELLDNELVFTYSRVLIYEDSIDNIIGVLNTKKFLLEALNNSKVDIRSMLTPPIYVHKTKSLPSILKVFKSTKTHMAIVVDEFGGTLGIITLEDVLEEIVGDIWDEMDTIEEDYIQSNEDTFIVDGDMNIDDMFSLVGYENDEFECAYSTVAGFCTEILDDFPKENDTFDFDNLKVTVLEVTGVRVEKVKIEVIENNEDEE